MWAKMLRLARLIRSFPQPTLTPLSGFMTDFFFVMPGFKRGAGRAIDLGAGLQRGSYLMSDSPAEADARAVASDWAAVDRDLAIAARQLAREQTKPGE